MCQARASFASGALPSLGCMVASPSRWFALPLLTRPSPSRPVCRAGQREPFTSRPSHALLHPPVPLALTAIMEACSTHSAAQPSTSPAPHPPLPLALTAIMEACSTHPAAQPSTSPAPPSPSLSHSPPSWRRAARTPPPSPARALHLPAPPSPTHRHHGGVQHAPRRPAQQPLEQRAAGGPGAVGARHHATQRGAGGRRAEHAAAHALAAVACVPQQQQTHACAARIRLPGMPRATRTCVCGGGCALRTCAAPAPQLWLLQAAAPRNVLVRGPPLWPGSNLGRCCCRCRCC